MRCRWRWTEIGLEILLLAETDGRHDISLTVPLRCTSCLASGEVHVREDEAEGTARGGKRKCLTIIVWKRTTCRESQHMLLRCQTRRVVWANASRWRCPTRAGGVDQFNVSCWPTRQHVFLASPSAWKNVYAVGALHQQGVRQQGACQGAASWGGDILSSLFDADTGLCGSAQMAIPSGMAAGISCENRTRSAKKHFFHEAPRSMSREIVIFAKPNPLKHQPHALEPLNP